MRVALHRGHGRLLRPVEHAQPPRAVQVGTPHTGSLHRSSPDSSTSVSEAYLQHLAGYSEQ